MKPIFEEERIFIKEKTGLELPINCWRNGNKIYLNCSDDAPIVKFKVENGNIIITSNRIKVFDNDKVIIQHKANKENIVEELKNKTLEEEYKELEDIILAKEKESIERTVKFIQEHPDYEVRQSDSGGKDSTLLKVINQKVCEIMGVDGYLTDHFNTSNDTADTYRFLKEYNDINKLQIHNPKIGMIPWIKNVKNYYTPTVTVRNCCSTYKEGKMKEIFEKDKKYIFLIGMRKYESTKRADYDWELNEAIKQKGKVRLNVPENWIRFLPIVEWKDEEVWLYLIHNNIPVNPMYYKGFNRAGCLVCPFQSDYVDLLIAKHYPMQWKVWQDIFTKNYEMYNVESRLKWSLEEWLNGKWKAGMSKEYFIIALKPTPRRVKELAEIKGISEDVALKYFQKECECGKKLNPDEVGMNLKIYGRSMNPEKMICKKCFCRIHNISTKEYQERVRDFRERGCNLF